MEKSKTSIRFSPEMPARAGCMVLEHQGYYGTQNARNAKRAERKTRRLQRLHPKLAESPTR